MDAVVRPRLDVEVAIADPDLVALLLGPRRRRIRILQALQKPASLQPFEVLEPLLDLCVARQGERCIRLPSTVRDATSSVAHVVMAARAAYRLLTDGEMPAGGLPRRRRTTAAAVESMATGGWAAQTAGSPPLRLRASVRLNLARKHRRPWYLWSCALRCFGSIEPLWLSFPRASFSMKVRTASANAGPINFDVASGLRFGDQRHA